MKTPSDTQEVFLLSKVNGCDNREDLLAVSPWKWPTETWLQHRLREKREKEGRRHEQD